MTRPRFDWLAPHYAWVEAATFGRLLDWCRTALVGELAEVIGPGRVRVHGEIWSTEGAPQVSAGDRVRVVAVEGLTLRVEPAP